MIVSTIALRPQDIAILTGICRVRDTPWKDKDIADRWGVSRGEMSRILKRATLAGLYFPDLRSPYRAALLSFLRHGLPFAFPSPLGRLTMGLPTSHAALPLSEHIHATEAYVWPLAEGKVRGIAVAPLYPGAVNAALGNEEVHALLSLLDGLRVGRARERTLAMEILEEWL